MVGTQITGLTVEGYKSFGKKQRLQVRPVTLLAGANSSGKSSVMQPLLLLKQTMDAPFDPGPLKIDGPNVVFSRNKQMFTHGDTVSALKIGLECHHKGIFTEEFSHRTVELEFQRATEGPIGLTREKVSDVVFQNGSEVCQEINFTEGTVPLSKFEENAWLNQRLKNYPFIQDSSIGQGRVVRARCFLDLEMDVEDEYGRSTIYQSLSQQLGPSLTNIIYIPGLRDPASVRSYPLMPVAGRFPGPMHSYLASIIYHWGQGSDPWYALEQDLRALGLAMKVAVEAVDDTALEILIDRYHPGKSLYQPDLVSLADVGLGLSQIMPVLAALRVAQSHHLVVMEQPELHLHPRGVHKLAEVVVDAVNRGVRIIMETHSELLLLGIQTLIAKGRLDPSQVSLNWFSLDEQGHSRIRQAEIEPDGSFGDWPVDFLDVELSAQRQYLDAVSNHE